jgi:hypothetical protein
MLFRREFLDGIRDGTVRVAFRRWRRPTVRAGGTLLTAVGRLRIASVATVSADRITSIDARRAGYTSREALLSELNARPDGEIYRIDLGRLEADPRVALRETPVDDAVERDAIVRRLQRLDARAGSPWTLSTLQIIRSYPGVRAADLSTRVGQPKEQFKPNVRKLKALGLTESLEIGYRLSPRGIVLLEWLRAHAFTRMRRGP